jgi:uncharacterized membrane protein YqjE
MALMEREAATETTAELLRDAIDDARRLVKLEVELAKAEIRHEVKEAKGAAIAFGIAALASLLAVTTLFAVLVVALGAVGGLIMAAALAVVGGVLAAIGYKLLPKKPLDQTRRRIDRDVRSLKEHIA